MSIRSIFVAALLASGHLVASAPLRSEGHSVSGIGHPTRTGSAVFTHPTGEHGSEPSGRAQYSGSKSPSHHSRTRPTATLSDAEPFFQPRATPAAEESALPSGDGHKKGGKKDHDKPHSSGSFTKPTRTGSVVPTRLPSKRAEHHSGKPTHRGSDFPKPTGTKSDRLRPTGYDFPRPTGSDFERPTGTDFDFPKPTGSASLGARDYAEGRFESESERPSFTRTAGPKPTGTASHHSRASHHHTGDHSATRTHSGRPTGTARPRQE